MNVEPEAVEPQAVDSVMTTVPTIRLVESRSGGPTVNVNVKVTQRQTICLPDNYFFGGTFCGMSACASGMES